MVIYMKENFQNEKKMEKEYIFEDKTECEGQFDKGKGKMKWKNGSEYNGNFNDLKLSGYEVLTNHIGDTYESIIVNYYLNLSLN